MKRLFDAEDFVRRLRSGEFDGHLQDELANLTGAQLTHVTTIMARLDALESVKRKKGQSSGTHALPGPY